MEQRGPQDAENTTVISAHSAEDVGSPDLVAPKKRHDRALRSLENWLSPHLGLKPGECKDLALKILSGNIRNKVPTGQTLRKLLRMPDAEEAMKFFSVVGIDEVTAQRLRDSCLRDTCRMPAATELSSRKRRHASDADGSGNEDGLMDDTANPQLLATLGSDDASAQMTDAAAGARLALPQAGTGIGHNPPPPSSLIPEVTHARARARTHAHTHDHANTPAYELIHRRTSVACV
jgi:hypothetical protein